jgi:F0F1-type ATP synthase delta subunit
MSSLVTTRDPPVCDTTCDPPVVMQAYKLLTAKRRLKAVSTIIRAYRSYVYRKNFK